ncbi:MAG: serine/threonine-protein phosphatase, partial [Alphaproteobacteria bacterium]|nr:serine/threonine-protein phosphatase [Alphaproteobacteria bacterium]
VYAIDVAGHGIASALMAARLASYLSGNTPASNIALKAAAHGSYSMRPLDEICRQLNDLVMDEMGSEKYFTMALADVDLSTGAGLLVQAGHPHPLLLHADGGAHRLGNGGVPVGMVRDARFEVVAFSMAPGDRLLLSSDGVSAGGDHSDIEATAQWLMSATQRHGGASGTALLDALYGDACEAVGGDELDDDFSAALLELKGP